MRVAIKPAKSKKCRAMACGASFVPKVTFQTWCSPDCAVVIARGKQEKKRKELAQIERREIKVRKEKLKSRAEHLREAQAAVNEFVRLRDAHQPCISCDSMPSDHDLITGSRWDAGHYRSVGACPELRFEPLNIHRQCVKCNRNLSGNAVEYRIRLVKRIGADKVDWLEGPHSARKYTVDEIKTIKADYRALTRELKGAAA